MSQSPRISVRILSAEVPTPEMIKSTPEVTPKDGGVHITGDGEAGQNIRVEVFQSDSETALKTLEEPLGDSGHAEATIKLAPGNYRLVITNLSTNYVFETEFTIN